jgi:hypothetical protein
LDPNHQIIFDQGQRVKAKYAHFLNLASPSHLEFCCNVVNNGPRRYRFIVPGLFDSYTAKGVTRVPTGLLRDKISWAFVADYSETSYSFLSLVPTGEQAENCRPSLFVAMQRDKCEGNYGEGNGDVRDARYIKCIRAIFMLHDEDDNPWQGSVGGVTTDEKKWVWTVDDGSVNKRNNGISNTSLPLTRKTMSRQCLREPETAFSDPPVREVQHITIDLTRFPQLSSSDTDMANGQMRLIANNKKSLPLPVSATGNAIYAELLALTGGDASALRQCSRTELAEGGVRWEVIFDSDAGDVPEITVEYEGNDCCCSCCTPIINPSVVHATNATVVQNLIVVSEAKKGFDGSPVPIVEPLCYATTHIPRRESSVGVDTYIQDGAVVPCYSNFLVGFELASIQERLKTCSPYCKPLKLTINKRW